MDTVRLTSGTRVADGSLVSLLDAAAVCAKVRKWFVVGGHMVNLHIVRSGLRLPRRDTNDADIAVPLRTIRQGDLVARIRHLGYANAVFDNRFDREVDGIVSSIDLLVASYSTKHQPNIDGAVIGIDGMPGVDEALGRDPVVIEVIAELTDGTRMEGIVHLPDLVSAITMKTFAVAERSNPRDAEDLGHLLEIAHAQGLRADTWPRGKAFQAATRQLSAQFDAPGSALAQASTNVAEQGRLRDITRSLLPTP